MDAESLSATAAAAFHSPRRLLLFANTHTCCSQKSASFDRKLLLYLPHVVAPVAAAVAGNPSALTTRKPAIQGFSKQGPCTSHSKMQSKKGYKGEKVYTARDIALGLIDVFGWSVEVDGKGEVGKVDEIVHIGRAGARTGIDIPYEYILKVVQPLSSWDKFDVSSEASLAIVLEDFASTDIEASSGVKILIPIVDEFMQHVDVKRRCLLVKPPAGLLELATRPEAIKRIHPEIQLFCQRYASLLQERFFGNKKIQYNGSVDLQEIVHLYMPTRDQLLAVGRSDLVRRIRAAGGFLYVAHALGLKSTRRPNGFWDDLEKLDFEIECFLLESWVKQVHKETGITYFENLVTKQVAVEKPVHNSNYKSSPVNCNGLRVMPQQKLLWKACRWDLHHAIISNGGYKEVAHVLGRSLIRRTKKLRQQQMDMLNLLVANHISSTECKAP